RSGRAPPRPGGAAAPGRPGGGLARTVPAVLRAARRRQLPRRVETAARRLEQLLVARPRRVAGAHRAGASAAGDALGAAVRRGPLHPDRRARRRLRSRLARPARPGECMGRVALVAARGRGRGGRRAAGRAPGARTTGAGRVPPARARHLARGERRASRAARHHRVPPAGESVREPADGVRRPGTRPHRRGRRVAALHPGVAPRWHGPVRSGGGSRPSGGGLRALGLPAAVSPVLLVALGLVYQQGAQPLRKAELVRLLATKARTKPEVVALVRRTCVTFQPSERDRADLRAAGADETVLAAIDQG